MSVAQREMLTLDPGTILVCAELVDGGGPEEVRGGVAQELRFLAALVMDAQAEARGAF